jgi:hypothetical protein
LLVVRLTGADTGAGVDTGAITGTTTPVSGSDTGSGTENVFQLGKGAFDIGSGSELAALTQMFIGQDSGSAIDNAAIRAFISALETGVGSDLSSTNVFAFRFGTDSGVGTEFAHNFERIIRIVEQILSARESGGQLIRAKTDSGKMLSAKEPSAPSLVSATEDEDDEMLSAGKKGGQLKSATQEYVIQEIT